MSVFETGAGRLRAARLSASAAFWRRSWLKGSALLLPPLAWFVLVYLAGARRAARFGILDGRPVHDASRQALEPRQLPHHPGRPDLPPDRLPHDRHRLRRHGHRRGARVPARLLHGPRREAAHAHAPVRLRADPAVGELPRARLRLAADPRRGRRAQLVARQARPAVTRRRLLRLGDLDRLLVHLAAVHGAAGVRVARAHPGLPARGVARPGRARLRTCARSFSRSPCPASSPARSSPSR